MKTLPSQSDCQLTWDSSALDYCKPVVIDFVMALKEKLDLALNLAGRKREKEKGILVRSILRLSVT